MLLGCVSRLIRNTPKNDFELFFDTVFTDDYGRWESEEFIPREIGYHKLVIKWLNRNADSQERSWNSEEVTFYVSE